MLVRKFFSEFAAAGFGEYHTPSGGLFFPLRKRTDLYFKSPSKPNDICAIVAEPEAPSTVTRTFASPVRVEMSVSVMSLKFTLIVFCAAAEAGSVENARHAAIASVPIFEKILDFTFKTSIKVFMFIYFCFRA